MGKAAVGATDEVSRVWRGEVERRERERNRGIRLRHRVCGPQGDLAGDPEAEGGTGEAGGGPGLGPEHAPRPGWPVRRSGGPAHGAAAAAGEEG